MSNLKKRAPVRRAAERTDPTTEAPAPTRQASPGRADTDGRARVDAEGARAPGFTELDGDTFLAGLGASPLGTAPAAMKAESLTLHGEAFEGPGAAKQTAPGEKHAGPDKDDPEPDKAKNPQDWAQWRMRQDERDLAELKKDGARPEDVQKMLREQSERFAKIMGALKPEDQKAFLEKGGADAMKRMLEMAGKDPDVKNKEVYKDIVKNLATAGDAAGRKNAELMARVMAENPNGWMAEALREGIEEGRGSLLAATTAKEARDRAKAGKGDGRFAWELERGTADGMAEVNKRFRDSTKKWKALLTERATVMARMKAAGISDAKIAAYAERFDKRHAGAKKAHEAVAKTYASSLEGQGYIHDNRRSFAPISALRTHAMSGLMQSGDLALTPGAAQDDAALALRRAGEGERTWMHSARMMADRRMFEAVVNNGARHGTAISTAGGDKQGLDATLKGLGAIRPELAERLDRVREALEAIPDGQKEGLKEAVAAAFSKGLQTEEERKNGDPSKEDPDLLFKQLGVAATMGATVAEKGVGLGTDTTGLVAKLMERAKDPRIKAHGSRLGLVGSLAGLAQKGFAALGTQDFDSIAKAVGSLATTGGDIAAFTKLIKSPAMLKLLAKGNLVTTVLFSAWDAASALARGNYEAAALAMSPVAGMGIGAGIGFFLGGPPGALLGAGIGALIGAIGQGIASLFGVGADEDAYKGAVTAAIKQALVGDLGEKAAERLAPYLADPKNKDALLKLRYVAEKMNLPESELLEKLAEHDDPTLLERALDKLGRIGTKEVGEGEDKRTVVDEDWRSKQYYRELKAFLAGERKAFDPRDPELQVDWDTAA